MVGQGAWRGATFDTWKGGVATRSRYRKRQAKWTAPPEGQAKRAQATGIEAEIERSEIAAQSPAAKRVAQKHRIAIHATNHRPVCRGRCRRVQLERLGPPWVRESTSHLFKISEFERTGRGPPAQTRADSLPRRARIQRNGSSPVAAQGGCGAGSGSRSTSLPRMRTCQDAGRIRRTVATATSRMGGAGGRVEIH